jgi:saccharopine dehydrogenase-like NADP-dependent oxidoreductase
MKCVKEIIIGDGNESNINEILPACHKKARKLVINVNDTDKLVSEMKKVDIVVNSIGPFYKFAMKVFNAALQARCHYVDVCDDWEPTLEVMSYHEKAKKAGITALIGMGLSPGISNLLAVKAIGELDSAEEIYTGWDSDIVRPEKIYDKPNAATIHGVQQLSKKIKVFRHGKYIYEKPIKKVLLDFPGIGKRPVWSIGHPEAVSLPAEFKNLQTSLNVMIVRKFDIFALKIGMFFVNTGIVSFETAAKIIEKFEGTVDPDYLVEKDILKPLKKGWKKLPPIFALAKGIKNGKPAATACFVTSGPVGAMGGSTGVPMAVGAKLIGTGRIKKRGVYCPESLIKPDEFLAEMAPLCSARLHDYRDTYITTRSWEDRDVSSEVLNVYNRISAN